MSSLCQARYDSTNRLSKAARDNEASARHVHPTLTPTSDAAHAQHDAIPLTALLDLRAIRRVGVFENPRKLRPERAPFLRHPRCDVGHETIAANNSGRSRLL